VPFFSDLFWVSRQLCVVAIAFDCFVALLGSVFMRDF